MYRDLHLLLPAAISFVIDVKNFVQYFLYLSIILTFTFIKNCRMHFIVLWALAFARKIPFCPHRIFFFQYCSSCLFHETVQINFS